MSIALRIRRGEGPVWRRAKAAAKAVLAFHLPAGGILRPVWRAMYRLHVGVREGWIWTRRFFWNEPLFRSQCAAVGRGFRLEELPYIVGQGTIVIGDNVRFSGKPSFGFCNRHLDAPQVSIGDGTFFGHQCSLRTARSIRIGRHCLLASGVVIADYDGHPLDTERRRAGETSDWADVRPVTIGDDVWIGTGAMILKGVTIGDRAIVAARAVVTRDVPPDCIVAGNPARVVKVMETTQPSRDDMRFELPVPESSSH